jgi:hypothetical protein
MNIKLRVDRGAAAMIDYHLLFFCIFAFGTIILALLALMGVIQ